MSHKAEDAFISQRSNYGRRAEDAYVDWIRRYILFHDKRHPRNRRGACAWRAWFRGWRKIWCAGSAGPRPIAVFRRNTRPGGMSMPIRRETASRSGVSVWLVPRTIKPPGVSGWPEPRVTRRSGVSGSPCGRTFGPDRDDGWAERRLARASLHYGRVHRRIVWVIHRLRQGERSDGSATRSLGAGVTSASRATRSLGVGGRSNHRDGRKAVGRRRHEWWGGREPRSGRSAGT